MEYQGHDDGGEKHVKRQREEEGPREGTDVKRKECGHLRTEKSSIYTNRKELMRSSPAASP